TGRSTLKIAKDRPGQLRANALLSRDNLHWYGDLVLNSHGEDFAEVWIDTPIERDEGWRPVEMMTKIARTTTEKGSLRSKALLEKAVTGRAASIRDALDYLILDGYVSDKPPY